MQQVEHFGNPTINVNDAFKAVTRYWDRIVHPEQILSSLPQAVAVMLDPAELRPGLHRLAAGYPGSGVGLPDEIL